MKILRKLFPTKPPYKVTDLPFAGILSQPNLPKPMHGLNPRTVLGQSWWDEKRHEAYAFFDYKCWACGTHKSEALYHNWLEGHEAYKIDYKKGRMSLIQIMALCHSCHNFIHSGRMLMLLADDKLEWDKFITILHHGFSVLKNGGQPPNWYALNAYDQASNVLVNEQKPVWHSVAIDKFQTMPEPVSESENWQDWRMVIDGQEYEPIHKTPYDWYSYYRK